MKTLLKAVVLFVLFALGSIGWMAWRNEKVRSHTREAVGSLKGTINAEILRSAERLADTLRKAKSTAETNKEVSKQ